MNHKMIQRTADKIRSALPNKSEEIEYGDLETVAATGRAKCKCCGEKIAKGDQALKFHWDFLGNGSFTAGLIQIHKADCKAK